MRRVKLLGLAMGLLLAAPHGRLEAQKIGFGPQLSWANDADIGIGVRVVVPVTTKTPLEVMGSFDYFFPSAPPTVTVRYWELNGNLVYLPPVKNTPVVPYLGGGLNIAHGSGGIVGIGSASNTKAGLNLAGGAKFKPKRTPILPFLEARVEISGGEQFVLTGGVQF